VFSKIIEAVQLRKIPDINSAEKNTWAKFLYEQWRRVPDFHEQIMPLSAFATRMQEGIAEYEAKYRRLLTDQQKERFAGDAALRTYRQNARVIALSRKSPNVMKAISDKACFGRTAPQRSFIIGSNPVVKIIARGSSTDLDNPDVEIWLPIHSNVMAVSAGIGGASTLVALHMDRIRGFNEAVAKKSTIFAGRSRELIASLAQKCL
jgi:hypothetical protein